MMMIFVYVDTGLTAQRQIKNRQKYLNATQILKQRHTTGKWKNTTHTAVIYKTW
jgi:uncharacterized protein YqgQ